jgi:protein tyrosine phosphatase (PTP) superfamily phosphohydrolase (DUF442 family)
VSCRFWRWSGGAESAAHKSEGRQGQARRQISRGAVIVAAGVLLLTWVGCVSIPIADRPETWAQPVELAGVANLYRVSGELYRGDQPTPQGMQNLTKLSIKTIINLRSLHSDRDELGATGIEYEHISMQPWHPEEEEVVRFLKIVTDPKRTPALVHCKHGADRTGTMVAVYRIAVQGWSKFEATREMTQGGFGYHPIWSVLPLWVQTLDIERIKQQAGIKSPPEQTE